MAETTECPEAGAIERARLSRSIPVESSRVAVQQRRRRAGALTGVEGRPGGQRKATETRPEWFVACRSLTTCVKLRARRIAVCRASASLSQLRFVLSRPDSSSVVLIELASTCSQRSFPM